MEVKMLVKTLELNNNDVYFIETLEDSIIINDNYSGVIILDKKLNFVKKIRLIDDLMIYSVAKYKSEILLYCPDNDCLIYVDTLLSRHIVISTKDFMDLKFSLLYAWNEEHIILSDYQKNFFKIDLNNRCLKKLSIKDHEYYHIVNDYFILNKFSIYMINNVEKRALVRSSKTEISLISYEKTIKVLQIIDMENYHSFETCSGIIAKIGEKKLEILFNKTKKTQYSSSGFNFLSGKFLKESKKNIFFLLSGDKSDLSKSKIQKYIIEM